MSKLVVRWTIILVASYLVVCYIVSALLHINIWRQFYYLLFELCVCLNISKQGAYHCKYIKWTAYAIFIEDAVVCSDVMFGYLPEGSKAIITPTILTTGLVVTTTLAVRHYSRNSIHSDNGNVIASLLGLSLNEAPSNGDYIQAVHSMALNMLMDADGRYCVRRYFLE